MLEDGIDPHRTFVKLMVVNSVGTLGPGLDFRRDVEGFTYVLSVHVVGEIIAKNGLLLRREGTGLEPRSVL